jgi:hypothetical protein
MNRHILNEILDRPTPMFGGKIGDFGKRTISIPSQAIISRIATEEGIDQSAHPSNTHNIHQLALSE